MNIDAQQYFNVFQFIKSSHYYSYEYNPSADGYHIHTFDYSARAETAVPDDWTSLPAPLDRESYRIGIPPSQKTAFKLCGAAIGVSGIVQPALTAQLVALALFAIFGAVILFRLLLVLTGIGLRRAASSTARPRALPGDVPRFSILVAAYQEAGMMDQLANALNALNWPKDRVEIFILMEGDDPETLQAAQRAGFSNTTHLVTVPPGGPRTKPNALNHGLALASGKYVSVYDVEDIPHPDQLVDVHAAFQRASDTVACIQAPLVATNSKAGWLAAQWGLEYDVQFGLLLPSLSKFGLPILLGGTSNHFRRDALLALGGWDAWNVTEDADLGMRIARTGLGIETVATPTLESAPTRFDVWCAQRSRWLKGFLQTWLVLMRSPMKTIRQMGFVRFLVMQLSLGGAILTPLAHAPCAFLLGLAAWSGRLEIGAAGLGLFCAGHCVGLLGDLAAPGKWSWRRLFAMATRPLYWPLHGLAAYRALWELANKPFFWAKTPHHPYDVEPRSFFSIGS